MMRHRTEAALQPDDACRADASSFRVRYGMCTTGACHIQRGQHNRRNNTAKVYATQAPLPPCCNACATVLGEQLSIPAITFPHRRAHLVTAPGGDPMSALPCSAAAAQRWRRSAPRWPRAARLRACPACHRALWLWSGPCSPWCSAPCRCPALTPRSSQRWQHPARESTTQQACVQAFTAQLQR